MQESEVIKQQKKFSVEDVERAKKRERTYTRRQWVMGVERAMKRQGVGPNALCPCASGLKYKKCHRPLIEDPKQPMPKLLDELHLAMR